MNAISYISAVLVVLIGSVVYLAISDRKLRFRVSWMPCPHCGTRMLERLLSDSRLARGCPSCGCCTDHAGNAV